MISNFLPIFPIDNIKLDFPISTLNMGMVLNVSSWLKDISFIIFPEKSSLEREREREIALICQETIIKMRKVVILLFLDLILRKSFKITFLSCPLDFRLFFIGFLKH